jgi:hypothetical protein
MSRGRKAAARGGAPDEIIVRSYELPARPLPPSHGDSAMSETPGGVVDPRPADGSPDIGTVVGVSARQDPDEEEDDEEEDDDTDDNGEDEGDSDGYSE